MQVTVAAWIFGFSVVLMDVNRTLEFSTPFATLNGRTFSILGLDAHQLDGVRHLRLALWDRKHLVCQFLPAVALLQWTALWLSHLVSLYPDRHGSLTLSAALNP